EMARGLGKVYKRQELTQEYKELKTSKDVSQREFHASRSKLFFMKIKRRAHEPRHTKKCK
ncbi:hypothetical protein KZ870_37780, partial [Pseudomonas aeruginosa]|nr:hypothetical protein [Pseudomonas aeruginosa]